MKLLKVRTEGRTDPEADLPWCSAMFVVGMYGVTAIEADDATRTVVVEALGDSRRIPYERIAFMQGDPVEVAKRMDEFQAKGSQVDPGYQHPKAKGKR